MSRSRGDDVIRGFYSQVLEDSLVVRVQGSVDEEIASRNIEFGGEDPVDEWPVEYRPDRPADQYRLMYALESRSFASGRTVTMGQSGGRGVSSTANWCSRWVPGESNPQPSG